jgi:hypothetical protein
MIIKESLQDRKVERFTIGIIILFTNHMSITQLQKKALTH